MIELNPETHEYKNDGQPVPGVNQTLREAGLVDYIGVPAALLARAAAFGTAVHLVTQLYDSDDLLDSSVDDYIRPYLRGWIKFLSDTGFEIETIEKSLHSKKYHYAGTPDRTGILYRKCTLISIKTTTTLQPSTAIKEAAYENLYNEGRPIKERIKRKEVVILGEGDYKLAPESFFDKGDFSVFLAALTIRNWRVKNGDITY